MAACELRTPAGVQSAFSPLFHSYMRVAVRHGITMALQQAEAAALLLERLVGGGALIEECVSLAQRLAGAKAVGDLVEGVRVVRRPLYVVVDGLVGEHQLIHRREDGDDEGGVEGGVDLHKSRLFRYGALEVGQDALLRLAAFHQFLRGAERHRREGGVRVDREGVLARVGVHEVEALIRLRHLRRRGVIDRRHELSVGRLVIHELVELGVGVDVPLEGAVDVVADVHLDVLARPRVADARGVLVPMHQHERRLRLVLAVHTDRREEGGGAATLPRPVGDLGSVDAAVSIARLDPPDGLSCGGIGDFHPLGDGRAADLGAGEEHVAVDRLLGGAGALEDLGGGVVEAVRLEDEAAGGAERHHALPLAHS
mmetsp:Transcript_22047/g.46681  ORF Transcript_22047/g.46681 Transcript_22047/m.46681 type:complete len:369 (+) Transcript_22047:426-1532(+)